MKLNRGSSGVTMGNFLTKNFVWLLAAGVGVYFYKQVDEKSKAITKPIGNFLAQVQFAINNSGDIKYPNAGFFLNSEKLDYTLKVNNLVWFDAIEKLHPAHKVFLDEIFDSDKRLKNQYRPLLNGLVDADSIQTVKKG